MTVAALRAVVFAAAVAVAVPAAARAGQSQGSRATVSSDGLAEAYAQFLLANRLDDRDDQDGAIAAYRRAIELDPAAAEIPAELAALYLRQNKVGEARATAEQALKVDPANREGNRVLGTIYAAMSDGAGSRDGARPSDDPSQNLVKAIHHLELAIEGLGGEADPNVRAALARAYVAHEDFDKAIPILSDLVNEQPQWPDGPLLLVEAFNGAGRTRDAIAWLEDRVADNPRLLPTLADFYEREKRWRDAAETYAKAVQQAPRSTQLRTRYASALLNAGGRENAGKARDVLNQLLGSSGSDARLLYLLSQAERRLGDSKAAEATARRVIAQNSRSPWGYYALAEALEERRAYQAVVDELSPIVAQNRGKPPEAFDVTILLPHLGFAYQELGDHAKAIAIFEEAQRLSPKEPAIAGYLVEANIAAKKYAAAIQIAKAALADNPDDERLLRLEAQALRHDGKADQGIALLEGALARHSDDPMSYVALAQLYSEAERGAQAVKLLQDAQAKFPADNTVTFELGAVFDKQKRFADAEAAFQQLLQRDPDNAPALNFLGYMLAERGERLDESVTLLRKALTIEPDNGSYLDSLGWAYFKSDKLDLAEDNLKRAADQLKTNSVIQDHYGELLFKRGRFDDAIAAWNRALAGDGDSIDRGEIDRKIRAARQKIGKK
jgi:tetratricopeptide (TPR) repeat protein